MPDQLVETRGAEAPCRDPECDGVAEPEVDGEHRYLECLTCGFTFGYVRIESGPIDSCAMGVPVSVRMAASAGMEGAQRTAKPAGPMPIVLGKKLK